jgi:hypothetical protein
LAQDCDVGFYGLDCCVPEGVEMGEEEKEREESVSCIIRGSFWGLGIAVMVVYLKVMPFENGIDSCYVSLQCLSSLP